MLSVPRYNDRAEVTRLVTVNVKRGAAEVVVYGISRKGNESFSFIFVISRMSGVINLISRS